MRRRVGQVIAPLLIIQRVADKSALTSDTVVSGHLCSFKAKNRGELTGGSVALPNGNPMDSTDRIGKDSDEHEVGVETMVDFHRDEI